MPSIDELLEWVEDGKWHELSEIIEKPITQNPMHRRGRTLTIRGNQIFIKIHDKNRAPVFSADGLT